MTKTLRVGGVPEHFNLPWRLAIADNAFSTSDAGIHYTDYPAGTGELTRALREDELDIALVLTEGGVADIVQHDKNRLVKIFVRSPLIWGIHVAGNSDISTVEQIRNKRVAISRFGSGSHLIAIVDAAERGYSTADMRFVVVDNLSGARRALAAGEADVFLWERHMTQPLVDSGEFRRVGQREVPWPAFAVSVRRAVLETQPQRVRKVLDVAARYASRLKRRRSTPSLIAQTYGLRLADAETWFAQVRWGVGYRAPLGALRRIGQALESQRVIGSGQVDPHRIWHQL